MKTLSARRHPGRRMARPVLLIMAAALMATASTRAADVVLRGPGYIGGSRALALAPAGDLWVVNSGQAAVFGPDGVFRQTLSFPVSQINSVRFDAEGRPVMGINEGYIARILEGGKVQRLGGFGSYSPWEVGIDAEGFIYGTDGGGKCVRQFSPKGYPRLVIASKEEPFARPLSLAIDAQGRLIVSDEQKNGLWIFQRDGSFAGRILADERWYRLRMGPAGLYAVGNDVAVIDPAQGRIIRRLKLAGGFQAAMGLEVDSKGHIYQCNQYDGVVREYDGDGRLLRTLGPSYRLTLSLPDELGAAAPARIAMRLDRTSDRPVGRVPPELVLALQPATLPGEPDLNWATSQGRAPDPAFEEARSEVFRAQERRLTIEAQTDALTAAPPPGLGPGIYRLVVRADAGAAGGVSSGDRIVRLVDPSSPGSLTIYVPRQRSVFRQDERIEINAILRAPGTLPAGTLRLSLARREGDSLTFPENGTAWAECALAEGGTRTLTFNAAPGLFPGRYLLKAEARLGASTLADTWPLTIVAAAQPTAFRILFPEWSAGYTHIWGPFTGEGMRADSRRLADEGILLYDDEILHHSDDRGVLPWGREASEAPALMAQASASAGLTAPERFIPSTPIEIELQEALRNGLQVQRDTWGSHWIHDWGNAHPLSIARDNRTMRLWTQWQRPWPSWIGHRYLSLSLVDSREVAALAERLRPAGIAPVADADLAWARNQGSRALISDQSVPPAAGWQAVGADAAGNRYVGTQAGWLMVYDRSGRLIRDAKAGPMLDLAVAKDATVYSVAQTRQVFATRPDGTISSFSVETTGYSPKGIDIDRDGNLLVSDEGGRRVLRYSPAGRLLGQIGNRDVLEKPAGVAALPDGGAAVADGSDGSVRIFDARGEPVRTIAHAGAHSHGGKMDVCLAPDGTLWVTANGTVRHWSLTGEDLGHAGRHTFAPGGLSLAMSVAVAPGGNLLCATSSLPYAQELKPDGTPVRLYGLKTLFLDLSIDRRRYTWADRILVSPFFPIAGQEGQKGATLQAFARPRQEENAWQPLAVEPYPGGDFALPVPHLEGETVLRLAWARPGAGPESPNRCEFLLDVARTESAADQARRADILRRQLDWKRAHTQSRMGALVRWTRLSNEIRPGTLCTAPMNWGTPDTMAMSVWPSYRSEAVAAEADNTGHDHGDFPLQGPWYTANALAGPAPKPAWASFLSWYWRGDDAGLRRPRGDLVLNLGAGATGLGVGKFVADMNESELACHRVLVARMRQVGEACMRLSEPGRGGVAVFHSLTQEVMDPYNHEHFWTAHAAWYDLLRAHVPAGVVDEDAIAAGALESRGYRAVLLPMIQFPLEPRVMDGLARFQKAGGKVYGDLATRIEVPGMLRLQARYRPFYIEDCFYEVRSGLGVGAFDGNFDYWIFRRNSDRRLDAVRAAFGALASEAAATDDPDVYLLPRQAGEAVYVFAANGHYPDRPLYETWLARDAPAPASADFTFRGKAVYDVFAMKRLDAGRASIVFTDQEPGRIFAVLPSPISSVTVRAEAGAEALTVTLGVFDAAGAPIPAVVPIELRVLAPDATELARRWTATGPDGACRALVPLGWQQPEGVWRIEARELLSGLSAAPAQARVGPHAPPALAREKSDTLVFDAEHLKDWLGRMRDRDIWIPLGPVQCGADSPVRAEAERLAARLADKGLKGRIVEIAKLPEKRIQLSYDLLPAEEPAQTPRTKAPQRPRPAATAEREALWQQIRAGDAVGLRLDDEIMRSPGPPRIVCAPIILLGRPEDNPWLKDIDTWRLAPRQISPNYPGNGRALIQYVWTPFYDGFDAAVIGATDREGLARGIDRLLDMVP